MHTAVPRIIVHTVMGRVYVHNHPEFEDFPENVLAITVGNGNEYLFVNDFSLIYEVPFWLSVCVVMSDSTRSAGVCGVSAFSHIEGIDVPDSEGI